MNNGSKSHKDTSLPIYGPNKLKIVTNGNGTSSVITTSIAPNGKNRSRLSKNILPAASTLELFTYVSFVAEKNTRFFFSLISFFVLSFTRNSDRMVPNRVRRVIALDLRPPQLNCPNHC